MTAIGFNGFRRTLLDGNSLAINGSQSIKSILSVGHSILPACHNLSCTPYVNHIERNRMAHGLQENSIHRNKTSRLKNASKRLTRMAGAGSDQNSSTHCSCSKPRSFKIERTSYVKSGLGKGERSYESSKQPANGAFGCLDQHQVSGMQWDCWGYVIPLACSSHSVR